jgi:hypothetical protein
VDAGIEDGGTHLLPRFRSQSAPLLAAPQPEEGPLAAAAVGAFRATVGKYAGFTYSAAVADKTGLSRALSSLMRKRYVEKRIGPVAFYELAEFEE